MKRLSGTRRIIALAALLCLAWTVLPAGVCARQVLGSNCCGTDEVSCAKNRCCTGTTCADEAERGTNPCVIVQETPYVGAQRANVAPDLEIVSVVPVAVVCEASGVLLPSRVAPVSVLALDVASVQSNCVLRI
jgi:hypothetical protein